MTSDARRIDAVTFDVGQTLVSCDTRMLVARLAEHGGRADQWALDREMPGAWVEYNRAKAQGTAGKEAWQLLMRTLLERAPLEGWSIEAAVEWLWSEQPKRNLWRRPIAGMIELARELRASGVKVGVVSNSEGRMIELLAELGWGEVFQVVVDSGLLTFEKPDPRMFVLAAQGLGVDLAHLVHLGDAPEADVRGALDAGARAILFATPATELPEGVVACEDAAAARAALVNWGLDFGGVR